MGIFDGIEKIINEHGSASILKERINLIREQHDAQVNELKSERDKLEAKCELLEDQLKATQEEIQQLKVQIGNTSPADGMDELEISILEFLGKHRGDVSAASVASQLDQNPTRVEYYLDKLERDDFVYGHHFANSRVTLYEIGHLGREYLVKNNLC